MVKTAESHQAQKTEPSFIRGLFKFINRDSGDQTTSKKSAYSQSQPKAKMPKVPSLTVIESDQPDVELPNPIAMQQDRVSRMNDFQASSEALNTLTQDPDYASKTAREVVIGWRANPVSSPLIGRNDHD